MFYFLSKILVFLTKPLCWVIITLVYIVWSKNVLRKRAAYVFVFMILMVMSNEILLNNVMSKWEMKRQNIEDLSLTYDYALVLLGRPSRIGAAVQMFKKGKVRNICILGRQSYKETKSELLRLGIPEENLFFENKSKNTYEHALFFRDFMADVQPNALDTSSLIMITSAIHVNRAMMCFDKQEISIHPFGINFISYDPKYNSLLDWIPSALALYHWEMLIKEWVGIATYKFMGYI